MAWQRAQTSDPTNSAREACSWVGQKQGSERWSCVDNWPFAALAVTAIAEARKNPRSSPRCERRGARDPGSAGCPATRLSNAFPRAGFPWVRPCEFCILHPSYPHRPGELTAGTPLRLGACGASSTGDSDVGREAALDPLSRPRRVSRMASRPAAEKGKSHPENLY